MKKNITNMWPALLIVIPGISYDDLRMMIFEFKVALYFVVSFSYFSNIGSVTVCVRAGTVLRYPAVPATHKSM